MTPVPAPRDALRLRGETAAERRALARAAERVAIARPRSAAPDATFIEHAGLGKALDDAYGSAERIFRSIAKEFEGVPRGGAWHAQLLRNMAAEMPSLRPSVLSLATEAALRDLLGFRHVFRNVYGEELDPKRLDDLAAKLPGTLALLAADLDAFDGFLARLASSAG